jgi:hypothetical protein
MPDHAQDTPDEFVRDIDAMARAVFTWVRQHAMERRFLGVPISEAEQSELAAGFLAGLRARFGLGESESTLIAYVYAVMRGERADATNAARELLSMDSTVSVSAAGYIQGLEAARQILGEQHQSKRMEEHLPHSGLQVVTLN